MSIQIRFVIVHTGNACSKNRDFFPFSEVSRSWKVQMQCRRRMPQIFCDTAFGMCVLVPGQEMNGNWWVPSHKVDDGRVVILATTVQHILQDCDYVKCACRNSAREKKDSKNVIFELRFLLRERGEAKMMGMKMEAIGFGKRKYMGLRAHHNFVADPDIPGYIVMARQMPCLCNG
jgi:hypothetical protein